MFAVYGAMLPPEEPSPALLVVAQQLQPREDNLEVQMSEVLPEEWNGKFVSHFLPLGSQPGNPEYQFLSHVALLEGPIQEGRQTIMFGDDVIHGSFVVIWFSEDRQKYYHLHCVTCALGTARWLVRMQPQWEKAHAERQSHSQGPVTYQ